MKNILLCIFVFLFVNINSQIYKYNPITKQLDLTGASISDTSLFNTFYVLKAGDIMTGDLLMRNAHGAANLTLKSDTFGNNFFNFEAAANLSIYPKGYKRVFELNQDFITFNSDSGNFSFNIDGFNQDTGYNYNSTKNKHTFKGNIISRNNIGINIDPIEKIHINDFSGNNSLMKFTNNATGRTVNDGSSIGINNTGNFIIENKENSNIILYSNGKQQALFSPTWNNFFVDSLYNSRAKINAKVSENEYSFRGLSQSNGGTGGFISIARANGTGVNNLQNLTAYFAVGALLFEGYCGGTFRTLSSIESIAHGSFDCATGYGGELKIKNTPQNTFNTKPYIKLTANQKTYISGDADGANNSVIESDGTVTFEGNATTWEDENLSGAEFGAGASAPDIININGTVLQASAFDGTATTEQLFGTIEIPHSYKQGSNIIDHLHTLKTTTGVSTDTAVFQISYQWVNINDNFSNTVTTQVIKIPLGNTAWKDLPTDIGTITGSGKTISSHFVFRIFRDPAHPSDNYTGDVALIAFGIHYEKDLTGSRLPTTK